MRGLALLSKAVETRPDVSTWSWATVTQVSPLRVRLDGESDALNVTPDTLVAGLAAGDRVWVQLVTTATTRRQYRRLVVLGRAGCPFPIGHIYISTDDTDPGELFGGVWERIEDRFLLAAGQTFTAGEMGGEVEHTLTVAEIPAHDHGSAGNHAHNVRYRQEGQLGESDASDAAARMFGGSLNTSSFFTLSGGGHTHASVGSGAPHNNMPPYLVVYVWERTG